MLINGGKSPDTNILWVTGFSGSGKSSIGRELSKNNKDVRVIALDDIFDEHHGERQWEDLICEWYDYMWNAIQSEVLRMTDAYRKCHNKPVGKAEIKAWAKAMDTLIDKIVKFCQKDFGNHRYVIEGIQIYDFILYETIQGQPLIIKGTSAIKSAHRAIKRDFADVSRKTLKDKLDGARNYVHLMTKKDRVDWYKESNKQMQDLEKKAKNK